MSNQIKSSQINFILFHMHYQIVSNKFDLSVELLFDNSTSMSFLAQLTSPYLNKTWTKKSAGGRLAAQNCIIRISLSYFSPLHRTL